MVDMTIPAFLRELVNRELERDERIEWLGMPKPTFFTVGSTGLFLFAIPWTAFAVFWIAGASQFKIPDFTKEEDFFPLFGIPFVLIGIGMLSTPYWTYRKTLHSVYVITDRRAITFEGGFRMTIRSYTPERLTRLYRTERKDGSGSVVIERRESVDSDGKKETEERGFMYVRNALEVERMLKQLAEKAVVSQ